MKKCIVLAALLLTGNVILFAQSNQEEIDLFQSVFGIEKKALVADFIKLEGPSKDAFWADYDSYEKERKALGQKRIALLNKYAENYATLDDTSTDDMVKDMVSLQTQTDKLIADYYKKIKKDAGVKPAAQFYQLEGYILSKIRSTIMENIPLIGQVTAK